jgi:dolichyl-phosphate-mannose-protein mannosyltransferase
LPLMVTQLFLARTALLDSTLMFFVLLAFYFLLRDQRVRDIDRIVWLRPWLIAAGTSLGAATAIKWSGLYFLAAFGLYVVDQRGNS